MKPKGIIPGITALCAILGMLIGVQYNTVQSQAASAAGTDNVRLTELSAELRFAPLFLRADPKPLPFFFF